ncbi:MAG: ATP synthase F1 subunit epsilon [bacterium]
MKLIILTPEKKILENEVSQVTVPTSTGEITILPDHVNLLSTLSLGNVLFKGDKSDSEEFITIESGFLTTNGKDIIILADVAIHSEEYEEQAVEEMKNRAEKIMAEAPKDRNIEKLKTQARVANLHLVSKKKRKI